MLKALESLFRPKSIAVIGASRTKGSIGRDILHNLLEYEFKGKVIKIGEATGAKFTLIPRDTTTGEFTKVVQRIPIKISVEDPEKLLKPGLSVTIGIETE